jgi:YD repeat-containing protein
MKRQALRSAVWPVLVILVSSIAGGQAWAGDVHYAYDRDGRLVIVNYGNGMGLRYTYDGSGNLLARVVGAMPLPPRITELSPASGPVGTTVTIRGTNLDTASETRFGAVAASFVAAAPDRLEVVVPSGAVTGRVQVTTSGGSVLSAGVFTVTAAVSETRLTLAAGGATSVSTVGPTLPLRSGYATASVLSGPTPYGVAVFSFTQNGVVVSEVGVPASPPTTSARIFIEHQPNVSSRGGTLSTYTGFAAVNQGNSQASLNLRLRDPQGATLATGTVRLGANAHLAKFIDQLAPDFVLPESFATIGFGSLEITSDQSISVLALRLTTNQRGDLLLTSTPIADLGRPAPVGPQSFPQVADGGGYQMALLFMNTTSTTETGVIRFLDDSGQPFAVRLAGSAAAVTELPYSVPPGGILRKVSDGSAAAVNTGWAQLVPAQGTSAPVGAGVFGFAQGEYLVTESGVAAATPTTRALIYIDKSAGHDTGLALSNPGTASLRVMMRALQSDGRPAAGTTPGTLDLPAGGHSARFVGQMIEGLTDGFTGVLEISSSNEFAALTLRSLTNARGDFLLTTFPIADGTRTAPSPIVFPQIVNGGGYQTQFLFLSPAGAASTVNLRFFGDDGVPIDIGRGVTP